MLDTPSLRAVALLALALACVACSKKGEAGGEAKVPEAAAAGVPDAAGGQSGDAFDRDLARYQLTMPKVRKWAAAEESFRRLRQQHPELARDWGESDSESADELAARIERIPGARTALQDAGLSAREYLLITFALVHASLGQMLVEQGQGPDSVARESGIHPANLRFVKENQAELAKYKQLSGRAR